MRAELKEPLGELLEGDPKDAVKRLASVLCEANPKMFAAVGDVVSRNILESGLDPDIVVVDHRMMRMEIEPFELGCRIILRAVNPAGTVQVGAWRALEEAVTLKKRVAVIVEGEEDLLVLPLVALMPRGSVIVYGQPGRGMVVVEVDGGRKRWAEGFMKRMEEG